MVSVSVIHGGKNREISSVYKSDNNQILANGPTVCNIRMVKYLHLLFLFKYFYSKFPICIVIFISAHIYGRKLSKI